MCVFHILPIYGSDAPWEHEVTGWFEEITDLTVTIVDNSTGDLVEEITVNIEPQPDVSLYQLKVANVKTHSMPSEAISFDKPQNAGCPIQGSLQNIYET